MNKIKHKTFKFIEKGKHDSSLYLIFDISISILIILNIIALVFETVESIQIRFEEYIRIFEVISVIIFSIEYIMRIYISDINYPSSNKLKSAFKFILSPYGLIDLLAILPFYLPFLIATDLRFIRILRLLRFVRIFKLSRYSNSLKLLSDVIKEKRAELLMTGVLTAMILIIASFLIYHIESEAQPDKFRDIPSCLWWAVETLTTVGYGDVYPVTWAGKIIGGIIALLGIGLVALPTGVISSGYLEKMKKKKMKLDKCPHCRKDIS